MCGVCGGTLTHMHTSTHTYMHAHSHPPPTHPPRNEQLQEVLGQGTPFSLWDSPTVIAWLEVWVGVPYWFIAAIRMCLQNGAMLAVSP